MQQCKILASILLMLSGIDFALAAPVFVQERGVRVSVVDAANDGTALPLRRDQSDKWPTNAADRTNAPPIPRSGYWREQVPRQHMPSNPAEPPDAPSPSYPPGFEPVHLPTIQAPTDEFNLLNPLSPHDDSHTLYPASPSDSRLLRSGMLHDNYLDSPLSSLSLNFKSLSDDEFTSAHPYAHDAPPLDDSPQTASLPDDSISRSSSPEPQQHVSPASSPGYSFSQDHVPFPSSKIKSLSELMSAHTHDIPPPDGFPQTASFPDHSKSLSELIPTPTHDTPPLDDSPQTPSSSEDSHSTDSEWVQPKDTHSSSTSAHSSSSWATDSSLDSWPPKHHVSPPESSLGLLQGHVYPQTPSSSDENHVPADSHSSPTSSPGSSQDHLLFPPGFELKPPSEPMSTHTPHTPPPGPTDNHLPPASLSNPGPSTEPDPPPSAKRPRPEDGDESWGSLSKIFKGRLKRRISGSGALNVAQEDLQGTFLL